MTIDQLLTTARDLVTLMSSWDQEQWFRVAEVLAVLFAAAVAWRQLSLLRRQLREGHEKACRDRALEYSLMRSPQLREMREAVDTVFPPESWRKVAIPWREIQLVLQQHPNLRICLIALFAHWENLALTIAAGVCDERMSYDMVAGTLLEYSDRFSQYLHQRRSENPRRYAYLILLADRWKRKLRGGKCKPHFHFSRGW